MDHGFSSVDQDDQDYSPENSQDSPSSGVFNDSKTTSTLTSKRSKRSLQKRVVSVPIKEIEGARLKSEINAPPSDSWAWRKYGQKPIKGSPYPRGYYRCSSSKGCPARKQVERNRADPTMVIVTYSCDHNHPWPASKNNHNHNHHHHHNSAVSPPPPPAITEEETSNVEDQEEEIPSKESIVEPEFTTIEPFVSTTDRYSWFSDFESPSSTMLESPLLVGDMGNDADMAMIFSIREEDESLFADLGELPECTTVFGRRQTINEVPHHNRPCNLATWCGTKG